MVAVLVSGSSKSDESSTAKSLVFKVTLAWVSSPLVDTMLGNCNFTRTVHGTVCVDVIVAVCAMSMNAVCVPSVSLSPPRSVLVARSIDKLGSIPQGRKPFVQYQSNQAHTNAQRYRCDKHEGLICFVNAVCALAIGSLKRCSNPALLFLAKHDSIH